MPRPVKHHLGCLQGKGTQREHSPIGPHGGSSLGNGAVRGWKSNRAVKWLGLGLWSLPRSAVTLGKSLNLSLSQSAHLKNRDSLV